MAASRQAWKAARLATRQLLSVSLAGKSPACFLAALVAHLFLAACNVQSTLEKDAAMQT